MRLKGMPGSVVRGVVCGLAVAACALGLAACDSEREAARAESGGGGSGKLRVVTTTGMIADAARAIAGDAASVESLMGEGVDPHLYKATPADLRKLEQADLILYNGLHLEGKLADVLEKLGKSGGARAVVAVAEVIPKDRLLHGEDSHQPDPHVWFDVALWSRAAAAVRDELQSRVPEGERGGVLARGDVYLRELAGLDSWCRERLLAVPEERRVLVTAHDAFGYFGKAYGVEVRGIQGISTDSEASIRDINALVDMLVEKKIPAVFIESSVPRKTIDALVEGCRARGHEVRVGGELFSDAMGASGTPEGTYVGMVRHNVNTIVEALGGGAPSPSGAGADAKAAESPS